MCIRDRVHTNTCMKGTTQDNWETAGAIAGGAAAVAGLTMGIIALSVSYTHLDVYKRQVPSRSEKAGQHVHHE